MSGLYNIEAPLLNNNDDFVTVFWQVSVGQYVSKGEVVAQLETAKAVYDYQAEYEGYVYFLSKSGDTVAVHAVIGVISATQLNQVAVEALKVKRTPKGVVGEKKWTKKAEFLAKEKGVNIEEVTATKEVVTENDVIAYVAKRMNDHARLEPDPFDWGRKKGKRLLLVGAGMNAIQALDVLTRCEGHFPVGIVDDDPAKQKKSIMGVPVVGAIVDIDDFWKRGFFDEIICLLPNNRDKRIALFNDIVKKAIPIANIIDPSVHIQSTVRIGKGNLILPLVGIGSCTRIGDNNFISSAVNFAHHNAVGSHCTFGPNVITAGMVTIGNNVKFGMNINIEPHVTVGDGATIASGALLTMSVGENALVKVKITTIMEK